jgi:hypothetical protein
MDKKHQSLWAGPQGAAPRSEGGQGIAGPESPFN